MLLKVQNNKIDMVDFERGTKTQPKNSIWIAPVKLNRIRSFGIIYYNLLSGNINFKKPL